ncbi:hypothetical protein Nepgr_001949 [Nepenthes gracilis]|uniref:Uncharacterized protein n=1 Tax=Nepenthes gracilis TaxID=150966 RepID=A0AAD3RY52_NEPGR|nr:hypothetical protein Nepgr_001949 [Nepenthes gracilis]
MVEQLAGVVHLTTFSIHIKNVILEVKETRLIGVTGNHVVVERLAELQSAVAGTKVEKSRIRLGIEGRIKRVEQRQSVLKVASYTEKAYGLEVEVEIVTELARWRGCGANASKQDNADAAATPSQHSG